MTAPLAQQRNDADPSIVFSTFAGVGLAVGLPNGVVVPATAVVAVGILLSLVRGSERVRRGRRRPRR